MCVMYILCQKSSSILCRKFRTNMAKGNSITGKEEEEKIARVNQSLEQETQTET
jgi:hypothetical protein